MGLADSSALRTVLSLRSPRSLTGKRKRGKRRKKGGGRGERGERGERGKGEWSEEIVREESHTASETIPNTQPRLDVHRTNLL